MYHAIVLAFAVAAAVPQDASVGEGAARPPFTIWRDARVELAGTFPERLLTGHLVSVDDDRLTLDTGHRLAAIARRDIRSARIRLGRSPARQVARTTLIGLGLGAALGAGAGLLLEQCTGECDGIDPRFVGRMAAGGASLGAGGGLVVGALQARRQWVTIPMEGYELQLRGDGGGAALRLSLTF
jgi:hypothetical protein